MRSTRRRKPPQGEFALIDWIRQNRKPGSRVPIGVGDDAAAFSVVDNRLCLVSTDMLLEGTHFSLNDHTPRQIGRKSLACSVSDIAAMGCPAVAAVVSLGLSTTTDLTFAKELCRGLWEVADELGVEIVGGDVTTGSGGIAVSVTIFGSDGGLKPVRRSGARPGDSVMVTGELGGSILGKHTDFVPRIREGLVLNGQFHVHSMIDISDGLLADLAHILDESSVAARLWETGIPVAEAARTLAEGTGRSALWHAMNDGEDYELLFTLSRTQARRLLREDPLGVPVREIGECFEGNGLWLVDPDEAERAATPEGYVHSIGS